MIKILFPCSLVRVRSLAMVRCVLALTRRPNVLATRTYSTLISVCRVCCSPVRRVRVPRKRLVWFVKWDGEGPYFDLA